MKEYVSSFLGGCVCVCCCSCCTTIQIQIFNSERELLPEAHDGIIRPVGTTVDEAERALILITLQSTGGNKTRAAELLGISLKTLHNKLKKYGGQT